MVACTGMIARGYISGVNFCVADALARFVAPVVVVAAAATMISPIDPPPLDAQRPGQSPAVRLATEANPLAGRPFYVDPISRAMAAAKSANPPSPELTIIANTPQAYWLDHAFPTATVAGTVSRYAGAAQAAGAMPILVLYAIPHRDCGSFAAGGFATAAGYRGWIDAVAAGLGALPAAIILEPDALAMADCLSPEQRQERFDVLSYAVDTLTQNPAAAVYVDGGHSRWVSAEDMAGRLNAVGVDRARGFSLNITNYYTTEEEIGYGETISALTGGAHYVIDTSRNGAGPLPDAPLSWCNPDGRALGVAPTTATYEVGLCNNASDSRLAVLGACGDSTTFIAADDDGCTGGAPYTSKVSWAATAGTTYYIAIGSYVEGGVVLSIDPDQIHTPGIYVQRIVQGQNYVKHIERRTTRPRESN
jgi:endoglucanase